MRKEIINGEEKTVYESEDWKTSIDENFKPGDYFDADIAWDLINAVPPHIFDGLYFQCGEPHDHREDKNGRMRPRFLTLVKVSGAPEVWQYKGNCFTGEQE